MQSHPVLDSDDEYYYDNVQGVAGADTTETALGSLGQSNRGYVVPEVEDPEADPRPAPLCQQCHEDARNVGPSERGTNPMLSEDQTFTVSAYASLPSEETTDNPRFQVFPHESDVQYFLVRPVVETVDDTETATYSLCLNCHSLLHEVPEEYASCTEAGCHDEGDAIDIHMLTASGCNACHGALEPLTMDCATCHGEDPHSHTDHTISFVTTGLDTDFFTARHRGGQNRRWVVNDIDCSICHDSTDIAAVHRYECATCHPGSWDEFDRAAGCQQSGCHPTYHAGALQGHNPYAPPNAQIARPCTQCHVENSNTLATPDFCTNCHPPAPVPEPVGSGLRSPAGTSLLTTSDVNEKEPYIGPAIITFTVTLDSVETTTATTYRRVDGGRIMAGSLVFVSGPGEHTIEYWSVAEDGAVEQTPHLATFTVDEDDRAPTTFSDVQPTYEGTATITLTALDNGYAGVMYTYFQLNDGPIQVWTGTDIVVPGPASGIAFHTLRYWSVDWSGNSEVFSERLFSVAAGTGTIRLIWGGGPPPPGADAIWTVRLGGPTGPLVPGGSGSAGGEGWDGVDDIVLPVSATAYYVAGDWYDPGIGWDEPMVFIDGSPGT
jgi:hypothetical protein